MIVRAGEYREQGGDLLPRNQQYPVADSDNNSFRERNVVGKMITRSV